MSLVVRRKSGGYIIGHNKTLSAYDLTTGTHTVLVEVEQSKDNRFNDGKCDATGRLFAGEF